MTTISLLGCGLMGTPMATRLLNHGYTLNAWNRTRSKADALAAKGARRAYCASRRWRARRRSTCSGAGSETPRPARLLRSAPSEAAEVCALVPSRP